VDVAAFTIAEAAPAKINLALHVTGRRADGYHLIESLVTFARFGDRVSVEASTEDRFSVDGPFAAGIPADESNLVARARDLLRRSAAGGTEQGIQGPTGPAAAIRLEKHLPVASGVGGGSSDAAATLRALTRLWNVDPGPANLEAIGRSLGADVPMCLHARPLVACGIGDEITVLPDFPALGLVLVNPGVAVSTADVFASLSRRDNPALPPLPPKPDFHGVRNWLAATRNDLEAPARTIAPQIGETLKALERSGAAFARMSGSGATCFGLFETGNMAKRAAAAIRRQQPGWFVAATRSLSSKADRHGQD
jgi:4-diphosphocytidyl-2-C-methyl-D-erythritol kinase